MAKRLTTEEFIAKAKKVHGDLYNYDKVDYINAYEPIIIHCNGCGRDFKQVPHDHLCGYGCGVCRRKERDDKRRLGLDEFVARSKKIHGDKYDYSEVEYVNSNTPVKIYCKKCEKFFWQKPHSHLLGRGCYDCSKIKKGDSIRFTTEKYIQLAKEAHGDKYDYSRTVYKGMNQSVEIYCNTCHEYFWQNASVHLAHDCPKCAKQATIMKNRKTFEEFVEKAKIVHRNDYDYSKANYVNLDIKIEIVCNKCHQSFWQTPCSHLNGRGCPHCRQSRGEKLIKNILTDHHIEFEFQKRFKDCKDNKPLPFDFYLPKYNLCIEYQGEQHYRPFYHKSMNKENGQKSFEKQQLHDQIKRDYCKSKGIRLLEIRYDEDTISKLEEEIDELREYKVS